LLGYTQLIGGYPGGQAEYVLVPFADTTHVNVPDSLTDEQVLFLADIFPTAWQAAVQANIQPTDTVAIWSAGPVGQSTTRSAVLLGAKQVAAIDYLPEHVSMAKAGGTIPINFDKESVVERLNDLTAGKGPEKCIDVVGLEAHVTHALDSIDDRAKQMMMESNRSHGMRDDSMSAVQLVCSRSRGVYGGLIDKFPMDCLSPRP
jgi:threonine dehydrogenase-like Zn-dependent dehydrogenase